MVGEKGKSKGSQGKKGKGKSHAKNLGPSFHLASGPRMHAAQPPMQGSFLCRRVVCRDHPGCAE